MKDRRETLEELRNDNFYTLLARELDLDLHNDVLIPRHKKIKDKKEREQRLERDYAQIKNIKILMEDLEKIIKNIDKKLKAIK